MCYFQTQSKRTKEQEEEAQTTDSSCSDYKYGNRPIYLHSDLNMCENIPAKRDLQKETFKKRPTKRDLPNKTCNKRSENKTRKKRFAKRVLQKETCKERPVQRDPQK